MNPQQPVAEIDDVNKSTAAYIKKNDMPIVVGYVVLIVACVAAIVAFSLDIRLVIFPILLGFVGYAHIQARIKQQFTQQFGASIGFVYSPQADMSSVMGRLFKIGRSQHIYDVLSGVDKGRSSRIYTFAFTVGSGKSSHTYNTTVFERTFTNDMPDITLTSGMSPFSGESTLFGNGGVEHVQLEGDFNKYFSLKVPKGYETEAYQMLPPDVMADLIDRAKDVSFEFNGPRLYIYANSSIMVREKLQAMFDLAEYLDGLFARSARAVNVAPADPAGQ